MNADSDFFIKIVHDQSESPFTINQNPRSRSFRITVHVRQNTQIIGEDIKTVEFGWPLGMSLVRKMDKNLWEVRSDITNKEIARVFFTVKHGLMILLHGFKKKSEKTPPNELDIAKERRDRVHNS